MSNEVKVLIGIAVVTILIVVGAAFLVGGKPSPTQETTKLSQDQMQKLIAKDSYVKGSKDAKVTLVEFGDFQCPACGAAHPTVTLLLKDYSKDIKFVYRQFPLSMHQHANIASHASEAAGAQGKFYEMYDALFQNQKEWENSKNPMENFEKYAANIGLDVEQFKKDVENKTFEEKIQQGITDGNAVGVQATPTFFLNGEKFSGRLSYDEFKTKIDELLKKS